MFTSYIPKYPLSVYIDSLWRVKGNTVTSMEKVLPTEHMELIINFGPPFKSFDLTNPLKSQLNKEAWIVGLHTKHLLISPTGESNMMGVRFKAGGGSAFFDFTMKELESKMIDMSLIWYSFVQEARERIFEEEDVNIQFFILEELLLKKLKFNNERFKIITPALKYLYHMKSNITAQSIAKEIGISHKQLIQKFKDNIGLSPNKFTRILRFHKVLNSIDPSQSVIWLNIALSNHYFDQAHFNKDFLSFTGMTPNKYLQTRKMLYGEDLKKGQDVKFVPLK